ncbi:MAG: hypothetical protein RSC41_01035 [Oscillospiraceae bacterium]
MYDEKHMDNPYVENPVESVERFNKNTGFDAKNNVNFDESSNILKKGQNYSHDDFESSIVTKGDNFDFENQVAIRKNIFQNENKNQVSRINTRFGSEEKDEKQGQKQKDDILQDISDNLEFLSRREIYLK